MTSAQRRARVEAKRHQEYSEEQLAAIDRALNELKPTEGYFAASNNYALEQQAQQESRGMQ